MISLSSNTILPQVQSTKPPWGTCGSKVLNYYDFYSVTACKMDCANERVRDKCGCRNLNMPDVPPSECLL